MEKKCNVCNIIKTIGDFYKNKNYYRSECKDCLNKKRKDKYIYKEKNLNIRKCNICNETLTIDKFYKNGKNFRRTCKECLNNKYKKIYHSSDKIKKNKNEYLKNRYKNDEIFRLKVIIRSRITSSFKNQYKKTSKTETILCCSFGDFKLYIENKFKKWMCWDNQGKYNGELNFGWDLDHIIPISSAKNKEEIIKLNHYTNFQPLCSKVNRDIKIKNIIK